MRAAWTAVGLVAAAAVASSGADAPAPSKAAARGDALLFEPGSEDLRPRSLPMWGLAVSPDGKTAVTTHGNRETPGELIAWNRETGEVKATVRFSNGIRAAAYTPDGKVVASAGYDGRLRLHDPATLAVWAVGYDTTNGHKPNSGLNGVNFFLNGRYVASAGLDNTVRIWDVAAAVAARGPGGGEVKLAVVAAVEGHTGHVYSTAASADGKTLLTGSFDHSARVWDLPNPLPKAGDKPVFVKKERQKFTDATNAVEAVTISPDGKWLAYGGWDGRLFVRPADGKAVEFTGQFGVGVMCVAFSPDGKYLVGGSGHAGNAQRAGEVKVWEVGTWKEVAARTDYPQAVLGVALTPDNKTVVVSDQDMVLYVWPWDGGERTAVTPPGLKIEPQPLLASALSPDGNVMAVAAENKSVFLYHLGNNKPVAELAGHADVVAGLAFSPDGKTLASASYDKTVKLWDLPAGKARKTLAGHTSWVLGVAFSPDGKTLATGGYDKSVRLWDVATGEPKATWKEHTAGVRAVAFSPDGKFLATAGSDRIGRVWDVAGGTVVARLKGHKGAVRSLAYAPDGKSIATGGEDKLVKVWDAATGAELRTSPALADLVTVVRYGPGGQTLVAGTFAGPMAVLDPRTGKRRQALSGHSEGVTGLVFADAGRSLVTVSQDKGMRRWGAVKPLGNVVAAKTLTGRAVTAAAFAPDGSMVLGGADAKLAYWDGKGEPSSLFHQPHGLKGVTRLAVSKDGMVAACGPDDAVAVVPLGQGKMANWKAKGRFAAFSPDGGTVAVVGDTAVTLHDAATGKPGKVLDVKALEVVFTPDGKRLVTAGADTKLRLWDVATGESKLETEAVGNLVTLSSLCVSPDGKRVAVACYGPDQAPPDDMSPFQPTKEVRVYTLPAPDATDWGANPVKFSPQPVEAETTGLAWVEDGKSVLVASADGTLRVNNLEGGNPKETRRFRAHEAGVAVLAATPDGSAVVTAGEDLTVRRWRLTAPGATPGAARLIPPGTSKVWASMVTPDGKHLFAAGSGEQKGFRVHAAVPAAVPLAPEKLPNAYALAFSPDNKWLVTGHDGGVLVVREAATGKEVRRLNGHRDRVWSAAFAAGGKYLVSVGGKAFEAKEPGEALVWDFAEGKVRYTLQVPALLWAVAARPDGNAVATIGGGKVTIWEVGDAVKQHKTIDIGGNLVAYSPDGSRLAVGNGDGTVKVVDAESGKVVREIKLDNLRPSRVLFSPDGTEVVVAAWRGDGQPARTPAVTAYKIDDPEAAPRQFLPHPESVMSVAFLDKDTLVTTGGISGGRGSLRVYDFASAKLIGSCGFHKNWGQHVAASPDGTLLASTSWGGPDTGEVRLWRAAGFRGAVVPVPGEWTYLSAGAVSPSGKQLVLGGNPKYLAVWDTNDPLKPVFRKELTGHAAGLRSVAYSADGKRFVTADDSGLVKVWDADTLAEVASFQAAKVRVNRARFTPDGSTIVTCAGRWEMAAPGEIKLWDAATGKETGRFPDQTREVWDVAFLDGGKRMVTVQGTTGKPGDAPLKVWDFGTKEVVGSVPGEALNAPRTLAVSADGSHAAVGSSVGPIRVFETAGWQEVAKHDDGKKAVFRVEFAPDGSAVVASSEELGTVVVRVPRGE